MTELTINQALQQGIEARKAGQVQEADRLYTAILQPQEDCMTTIAQIDQLITSVQGMKASFAQSFWMTILLSRR